MPLNQRESLRQMWSETDGRGHRAEGTASGTNTRRDHGLLIRVLPDGSKRVLLHQVEEWLHVGEARYPLTSTMYRDLGRPGGLIVHPDGHANLESFHAAPFPRWVIRAGPHRLIRTLRPVQSAAGFLLDYLWVTNSPDPSDPAPAAARLELRLMVSGRDATALASAGPDVPQVAHLEHRVEMTFRGTGAPPLQVAWPSGGAWRQDGHWYRHVRLVASGTDEETLWSPGVVVLPLVPDRPSALRFSSGSPVSAYSLDAPSLFATAAAPAAASATLRRTLTWSDDRARFQLLDVEPGGSGTCEELEAVFWLAPWLEPDLLDALSGDLADRIGDPELPLDGLLYWALIQAERARRGRRDETAFAQVIAWLDALLDGSHPAAIPDPATLLLSIRSPGQSFWDRAAGSGAAAWRTHPIDLQALWSNALAAGEILGSVLHCAPASPYGRAFLRVAESIRSLYWIPRRTMLADDLERSDTGEWTPAERMSSAGTLALALRFEILPPSRARAVLGHVRRHLSFESHPRSGGHPGMLIGMRAFAGDRVVYPSRLVPWLVAHARLAPGAPAPGLSAAGVLKHFTRAECTVVPSCLDPRLPSPRAHPEAGNEVEARGVSLAGLAGLIAAALAQDSGDR